MLELSLKNICSEKKSISKAIYHDGSFVHFRRSPTAVMESQLKEKLTDTYLLKQALLQGPRRLKAENVKDQ